MTPTALALTRRDHDLVHAAWSLGWATCQVLTDVVSPGTLPKTLAMRLSRLAAAGYLRRRQVVGGPQGHVWLYGTGRNAASIDPGYADAWRPPDFHLAHTIEVGTTLAALVTPGRLGKLTVTSWQGQAELRTWHQPGQAMADLHLRWATEALTGAWHVEVDRGTESRHALRRKLIRYLHTPEHVILVVTTSDERARNIAVLARELGAAALTTDRRSLHSESGLRVYDAVKGVRRPVDE